MDDKQDSLSLLEKARLFRAQTPEKWEARKEERKQGHCELLGNQEALPYVKQYLEKQKISKKDLSQESSDEVGFHTLFVVTMLTLSFDFKNLS